MVLESTILLKEQELDLLYESVAIQDWNKVDKNRINKKIKEIDNKYSQLKPIKNINNLSKEEQIKLAKFFKLKKIGGKTINTLIGTGIGLVTGKALSTKLNETTLDDVAKARENTFKNINLNHEKSLKDAAESLANIHKNLKNVNDSNKESEKTLDEIDKLLNELERMNDDEAEEKESNNSINDLSNDETKKSKEQSVPLKTNTSQVKNELTIRKSYPLQNTHSKNTNSNVIEGVFKEIVREKKPSKLKKLKLLIHKIIKVENEMNKKQKATIAGATATGAIIGAIIPTNNYFESNINGRLCFLSRDKKSYKSLYLIYKDNKNKIQVKSFKLSNDLINK